jgi:hypothetical protein
MVKLTDQFIRSLRVPEGAKDVQALDDSCPGFGVQKQASGHTKVTASASSSVAGR